MRPIIGTEFYRPHTNVRVKVTGIIREKGKQVRVKFAPAYPATGLVYGQMSIREVRKAAQRVQ